MALGTVTLSRKAFAEHLVAKFGVTRNKETPIAVGLKLEDFDEHEPDVHKPFRSLVGHLMWLANQTRPDTLNAVQANARYSHAPKLAHSSGNRGTDNEALVGWYHGLVLIHYLLSVSPVPRLPEGLIPWPSRSILLQADRIFVCDDRTQGLLIRLPFLRGLSTIPLGGIRFPS